MKGLAGMLGDSSSKKEESSTSLEDEHLTDAFDAARKDDRKAFITAMKSAIRACMDAEEAGEYDEPKVIGQGAE